MSKDTDAVMEGCGCFVGFLFIIPLALYNGWVSSHLWGWFVTPVFGVNAPAIPTLAGLIALAKYGTYVYRRAPKGETTLESVIGSTVFALLMGAMMLVIGYVLHRMAA